MRLQARIVLFLALACVLPLFLLAGAASRATATWLAGATTEFQYRTVESLASVVARQLNDAERVIRLQFANFALGEASPEVRRAFLVATYRLFPEVSVALLRDADGVDAAPPVYLRLGEEAWVPGHEQIPPDRVDRLRQELPAPGAAGTATWGRPYRPPVGEGAVYPITFASPWGDGMTLGVELGMGQVPARIALVAGDHAEAALLGLDGATLVRAGVDGLVLPDRFREILGTDGADVRYADNDGEGVRAALARVPGHPLVVVLAEPASAVEAAGREIQLKTWYIGAVSLLLAGVGGWILGGSIIDPVRRLRDATRALGAGDFTRRVPVDAADELGDLGRAFNGMAASLARNAEEIAAKNNEIERFNRELQDRVEQRTAQLKEAQARLVQSGQLAAVAELSSGLAHELNNPLAGLLGMIQLARARGDSRQAELLDAAEREALRCKDIVGQLLRFTRDDPGAAGRERDVVDLDVVIADVLGLMRGPMESRGMTMDHQRAACWVRGDAAQLGRAVGQLLTSIRTVAAPGAHLGVSTTVGPTETLVHFTLSQVVAGQDDWRAASFGFWVARQVFEDHATILEEPVTGGTWRLRVPTAEPGVG